MSDTASSSEDHSASAKRVATGPAADLRAAAIAGHAGRVRDALDAVDARGPPPHRATVLHHASRHGHTDAARALLDRGANVEAATAGVA